MLKGRYDGYTLLTVVKLAGRGKVRPSEIEYLEIRVHNPCHEDLIELKSRMSAFFKLDDV